MPSAFVPMTSVMRSLSWLRGLTARMLVASGALVVAIAVVFAVLLHALEGIDGKTRSVAHSMEVLAQAGDAQNSVSEFATATANYIGSGDPTILDHWDVARAEILLSTAQLQQLVSDNPVQERAAAAIRASAESFIKEWGEPMMTLATHGRRDEAQRIMPTRSPRQRMAEIRQQFERFRDRERALGERRAEPTGAAADIEHALPMQLGLGEEPFERRPPARLLRPEAIVLLGEPAEVSHPMHAGALRVHPL
jgi:CHASE3 domain sensor protein